MTAAQRQRLRAQRIRRNAARYYRRRHRNVVSKARAEDKNVALVTNEAESGTTSGLLNINLQVPIQLGANAQNVNDSDGVSTTVI